MIGLFELSNNKLFDNNLASELVENRRFFKPITIEEIVVFMIIYVIVCYHRHIWTTHCPYYSCHLNRFLYRSQGIIFYKFTDDAGDRQKLGIKRNTLAQGINRIVYLNA